MYYVRFIVAIIFLSGDKDDGIDGFVMTAKDAYASFVRIALIDGGFEQPAADGGVVRTADDDFWCANQPVNHTRVAVIYEQTGP